MVYVGWELPTSHCMIVAVRKEVDRAHGKSDITPKVSNPQTWEILAAGRAAVEQIGEAGRLSLKRLAGLHLPLCRALGSGRTTGLVHLEF